MSFLAPSASAYQPPSDSAASEAAAARAREEAARAALADSKMRGRAAMLGQGAAQAAEEQYGRGLLSQKRRAAKELVG